MAKKKISVQSLEETQEKLNKVGEALGVIDKVILEKPEEILSKDIIAKDISNQIKLEKNLELSVLIDDFNFMRDTLKYNIEKSKAMMSSVGEGFNAYDENSAVLISGYAALVKAVNDSVNLFSNLHKTLNQIVEKKKVLEEKEEDNSIKNGISISDITRMISKNSKPIDIEIED